MKDESQRRIENIAKTYDSIETAERYFSSGVNRLYDLQFKTVVSILKSSHISNQGTKALDIGCSGGRYTNTLVSMGIDTIGIDTAINPLIYASKRIDAPFIRASVLDLPFEEESFDLVLCINLLSNFTDEYLEKILIQISNVIKPGGILVFDVKNKLNPILYLAYKKNDSVNFTLKARTTKQMIKLIEKHGFEVIKKKGVLSPIVTFAPFVIVFVRKEEK
jgi:ubiquinone/menaquinone biosynthesis C-methylase UbiE